MPTPKVIDSVQGECKYVLDGTDTDGTEWFHCILHDALSMGSDWQCENA